MICTLITVRRLMLTVKAGHCVVMLRREGSSCKQLFLLLGGVKALHSRVMSMYSQQH